jgi:hypothetical protein
MYTYGEQATHNKWRMNQFQLIQDYNNEIIKFINLHENILPYQASNPEGRQLSPDYKEQLRQIILNPIQSISKPKFR